MTVPAAVLARLVAAARAVPAGLGGTRLVLIDGPAGSGKTTLAAQLEVALPSEVVHMDDLYEGWTGIDAGVRILGDEVLAPLARGETGSYARFDWTTSRRAERHEVNGGTHLVVEGCGSASRVVDVHSPLIVWVEANDTERLSRGLARDGEAARDHWQQFMVDERAHYAGNATAQRAHVHLDGTGNVLRWAARTVEDS